MDADFISFEAMLAAKDSAQWAYWGMWIALFSAITTFFAMVIGGITIFSWRKQEALKDKKAFVLSVLKFQKTVGLGPEAYQLCSVPDNDPSHPFWTLTHSLTDVYEAALLMTAKKERAKATRIYTMLDEIYESLHQGRINSRTATARILAIQKDSFFEDY